MQISTANLCDNFIGKLQIVESLLISFGGKKIFSGVIVTVRVFDDNTLLKQQLAFGSHSCDFATSNS